MIIGTLLQIPMGFFMDSYKELQDSVGAYVITYRIMYSIHKYNVSRTFIGMQIG